MNEIDNARLDALLCTCSGDDDAYRELYELMYKPVYAVYHSVLCKRFDAEDCAQETFARLPMLSKKYKPGTNARAYIFKIAVNVSKEHRRKYGNRFVPLDENIQGGDDIAKADSEMRVNSVLSRLDAQSRTIVVLYVFEELTYEQIGGLMKLPYSTVRRKYLKAVNTLKGELQ